MPDNTTEITSPSDPSAFPAGTLPAGHNSYRPLRNPMLDASRLAAAIAILWMHTWEAGHLPRPGEIGRFAVPFFTIAAIYLLTISLLRNPNRPFVPYAVQRFNRLYVPFLAWSILGLAAMRAKHHFITHTPNDPLSAAILLMGSSFQLWYLPFIFFVCIGMFLICKTGARLSPAPRTVSAILALAVGCAMAFMPRVTGAETPGDRMFLAFSWNALPSAFWGYAMAILLQGRKIHPPIALGGLVLTIVSMAAIALLGRNIFLETLAGGAFMLFALLDRHGPLAAALAKYPFLIYGTYLSQGVILEVVQTLAFRAHHTPSPSLQLAVFSITAVLCITLCFALNQSRTTRWLLG